MQARANLLQEIRTFFADREVLEVATPAIGAHTVSDCHLSSLDLQSTAGRGYLQTSPEYALKRLVATHKKPVFEIARCFRDGETGPNHNIEFTMLEWYRPQFTLDQLMKESEALLCLALGVSQPVSVHSYQSLFQAATGADPHSLALADLVALAKDRVATEHITYHDDNACKADYLDAIFSELVEPGLSGLTFVYDYPACQAALARLSDDNRVARRFEVFFHNIELANGYDELCDASVLRSRMTENNRARDLRGLPLIEPDERLLAALDELPACAGIAVGIDRLLMLRTGAKTLAEVMTFTSRDA